MVVGRFTCKLAGFMGLGDSGPAAQVHRLRLHGCKLSDHGGARRWLLAKKSHRHASPTTFRVTSCRLMGTDHASPTAFGKVVADLWGLTVLLQLLSGK